MDELEQQFLDEVCHMRLQIAYQRFLKTRTAEMADKEQERDNHIEELYNRLLGICNEEGKELFRGFVFERTRSNSNSISFVCYDHAEKLNKIEVAYNGKGKTPSGTMKDLLTKYGFSIGSIASSSVKRFVSPLKQSNVAV
mgnify:CR=1 FL=1